MDLYEELAYKHKREHLSKNAVLSTLDINEEHC